MTQAKNPLTNGENTQGQRDGEVASMEICLDAILQIDIDGDDRRLNCDKRGAGPPTGLPEDDALLNYEKGAVRSW